jgi:hypothetical protein
MNIPKQIPHRSVFTALIVFWCICWGHRIEAQELAKGQKETVMIGATKVLPSVERAVALQNKSLQLARIQESLASELWTALSSTRVFQLVERQRRADLELEQAFAAVAVDGGDKNAAKALKMAGVKFILLPEITAFEDKSEAKKFQNVGASVVSRKIDFSASVRIADTTAGNVLPDVPSLMLSTNITHELGHENDKDIVLMAKLMANQLCQKVVGLLRPAKVLSVTGKQIQINRGVDSGFVVGARVEVYAVQEKIDEDSGEKFLNEMPVGQAVVKRSDAKQSFAMIEGENMGIAERCIVKVLELQAPIPPPSAPSRPTRTSDDKDW